jgi:polyisoprenyl-phosphate glycosyltransferase
MNPRTGAPELSVVIPVYNEEPGLAELRQRVVTALEGTALSFEVIFVNDGSGDGSARILSGYCLDDSRLFAVHLSRNFGHQAAVAAGIWYAAGSGVIVMDADLQDPPELIPELISRWREGNEVVYTQRARRPGDSLVKRALTWAYYRIIQRLADTALHADSGDFCLMDRRVVDLLNQMPERHRYIRGLRSWVGFRQVSVVFERPERFAGEVKYTFAKLLRLGLDGIFSQSTAPLRLATYFGLSVSLVSFLMGILFIFEKLTVGVNPRGWASTIVIVLFLGGVQLLTVGIIGEYLGRVYEEVKQRPLFVVRDLDGFPGATSQRAVPTTRLAPVGDAAAPPIVRNTSLPEDHRTKQL